MSKVYLKSDSDIGSENEASHSKEGKEIPERRLKCLKEKGAIAFIQKTKGEYDIKCSKRG